jgi:hypothetical protein
VFERSEPVVAVRSGVTASRRSHLSGRQKDDTGAEGRQAKLIIEAQPTSRAISAACEIEFANFRAAENGRRRLPAHINQGGELVVATISGN